MWIFPAMIKSPAPLLKGLKLPRWIKLKSTAVIYFICGGMAWIVCLFFFFFCLASIFDFTFFPLKIPVHRHFVWAVCVARCWEPRVSHMLYKGLTTEEHALYEALVLIDSFILKRSNTLDSRCGFWCGPRLNSTLFFSTLRSCTFQLTDDFI